MLAIGATAFAGAEKPSEHATRPNFVVIFIDDMGYGDIGPFGSTQNKTPHLDRMAKEGMVFTDFYVSSTACTPSRSALITGCYADRVGMDGRVCFPAHSASRPLRSLDHERTPWHRFRWLAFKGAVAEVDDDSVASIPVRELHGTVRR